MPATRKGSCRCGAVSFEVLSHTPQPYQLCDCSICRKTAGGGGNAINLAADAGTLAIEGKAAIRVFRAEIADGEGACRRSTGERSFCRHCATALWLFDPAWPDLAHPFASAIDSDLPVPPSRVHLILRFKPAWSCPGSRPATRRSTAIPTSRSRTGTARAGSGWREAYPAALGEPVDQGSLTGRACRGRQARRRFRQQVDEAPILLRLLLHEDRGQLGRPRLRGHGDQRGRRIGGGDG